MRIRKLPKWVVPFEATALIMVGLVAYWQWTRSPTYALRQIRAALHEHDFAKFQKYVDIESLTTRAIDDLMAMQLLDSSPNEAEGNALATGFVQLVKPRLIDEWRRQINRYVESGKFGGQRALTNMFSLLERGESFVGVTSSKREGKICVLGLHFTNNVDAGYVLEAKMRQKGYWQLVELSNLSAILQMQAAQAEAKAKAEGLAKAEAEETARAEAAAKEVSAPAPVTTAAPAEPEPSPKELPLLPAVWTLDVAQAEIPEGKANGTISGTDFVVETAVCTPQVLRLYQGLAVSPEREILVYLRLSAGESLTNHTWTVAKDTRAKAVSQVVKRWKTNPRYAAQARSYSSGYALKLELGDMVSNAILGKIFLALPDTEQSVVAGHFQAMMSLAPAADSGSASPVVPLAAPPAAESRAFQERYGKRR